MYKLRLNTYHLLLPILILVLALGLRSYRILDKDSLFMDENLSVVLSNYGTYGFSWPAVAADDEIKSYDGRELINRMFDDDNSLNNVLYDLWNLRKSTRDSPHTNLYYSLLRISFLGADTADLSDVIKRGFLLNVLFFVIGFFFLYKLSKLLFRNSWVLIGCTLTIMAINPISISNTIFLRSYQLQEMLFIVLVYLIVVGASRFKNNRSLLASKKYILGLVFITSLALLAGYFGVPFVLMMWVGFVFYIMQQAQRKSRLKLGLQLFGVFVAVIALTFLIYPAYMDGLSGNRGVEAAGKLSPLTIIKSLDNVIADIASVIGIDTLTLFIISFLLGIVLLFIKRKDVLFERIASLYVISCSVVWMLFAFYLAPVKEVRYISPIMPILYLIFPFVLSFISNKIIQSLGVLCVVGFFAFKSVTNDNIYWGKVDVGEYYKKDVNTPLVVGGVYSPWLQLSLAPYFTDGRTVLFTFDSVSFSDLINQYKEVYVILGGEKMDIFTIPDGYVVVSEKTFPDTKVEAIGTKHKVKRISEKE